METKFTKGEWAVSKDKAGFYIDSNSGMICEMNGDQPSNIANAKLIKMAPKMISMLIAISETLESGIPIHKGDSIHENMLKIIKEATE